MKSRIFRTMGAVMLVAMLLTMTVGTVFAQATDIGGVSATVAENTTAAGTAVATGGSGVGNYTYAIGTCATTGADDAKFSIVGATGVLTFVAAPNFEVPTDAGTNNVYNVCIRATDTGDANTTFDKAFAVTVTDVNEPVTVVNFTTGAATSITVAENQTVVSGLTPVGGSAPYTYAKSTACAAPADSADNASFGLTTAGVVTFATAPNFEVKSVYKLCVAASSADPSTDPEVKQALTVNVSNVNEVPSFTKGANVTVAEDSGAYPSTAWATVFDDGDSTVVQTLSFAATVPPADAAKFSAAPAIAADGKLTFTPAANASGVVTVSVTITDDATINALPALTSAAQTFTITITANNNDAPTDITGVSATVAENTKPAGTMLATDPDATNTHVWSLATTGTTCNATLGADNGKFTVTGTALSFTAAPDFETAADANTDNNYQVCVNVADAAASATFQKAFTVAVTNVNETPVFTKGANITVLEDSGAYPSTAWATAIGDGDSTVTQALTFAATVSTADALKFSAAPAIAADGKLTFTPAANANGVVTVSVTLTDEAIGATPAITTAAQTFTITLTAVNDAPTYTAGPAITIACDLMGWGDYWADPFDDGDPEVIQTLTFSADLDPAIAGIADVIVYSDGFAEVYLADDACANTGAKTIAVTLTDSGSPAGTVMKNMTVNIVPVYTISGTITPNVPTFGLLAGGTEATFAGDDGWDYVATANLLTGAYTIEGVPATVAGTLTAAHTSGSGYTFAPASYAIPAMAGNVTGKNFVATGNRQISGTLTGTGGARLPAGTVATFGAGLVFTGSPDGGSATTAFSLTGIPPKSYVLKPVLSAGASAFIKDITAGNKLSPTAIAANTAQGNDTMGNDFAFSFVTHTISGTLKAPTGGNPVGKAFTVKMAGTGAFAGVDVVGSYKAGTYTVTVPAYAKLPSTNDPAVFTGTMSFVGTGYQSFSPLAVYSLASAVNQDVVAYGDRSIFGDPAGAALNNATISFGGGLSGVVENDYFTLPYLERKSYSLTPTAAGFFFTPSATNFAQVKLTANLAKADADLSGKMYVFVVPVNSAPASGSVEAGANVTFTWSAVPGITKYRVEYATNSSFSGKVVGPVVAVTTYTPATNFVNNAVDKTYYWRVVPMDAAGTKVAGPASAATTFKR